MPTLCLFEDIGYRKLLPLTYTRPVYDLRCGIATLREKIVRPYPGARVALQTRDYLVDVLSQNNPRIPINRLPSGPCLFVNGRVVAGPDLARQIPLEGDGRLFVKGDAVVAARVQDGRKVALNATLDRLSFGVDAATEVEADLITYPWDLVNRNADQIKADAQALGLMGRVEGGVYEGVHIVEEGNLYIGPKATVKPGAVLDAEEGPIVIDEGAKIYPNATIEGPAYIGKGTWIKIGAKIYEGTSIGEVCKVGGEVEGSIIHSFSNKQHDGFLGHAYLGMWVNLGADTNNSDLKNNYSPVDVFVDGEKIDSGSLFVGLTMGDHSKSGINTMFNTGTVVGVSCNVFGAGFPPKDIPSFSWGGAEGLTVYDPARGIETCRRVMKRRKIDLTAADEALLRRIFELTKRDRERAGVR